MSQEDGPLVSIITPVYETDPSLIERAVSSVERQTYRNWNLIVIDDGSSPECSHALDALAERDARIAVLHQPNGGVSHARNTGLGVARGEYVAFLDADDQFEASFLAEALRHATSMSLDAVLGCVRVTSPGLVVCWRSSGRPPGTARVLSAEELTDVRSRVFSDYPSDSRSFAGLTATNLHAILYSMEIVTRVSFTREVSQGEDRIFNFAALGHATRVGATTSIWYTYDRTVASSASRLSAKEVLTIGPTLDAFSANAGLPVTTTGSATSDVDRIRSRAAAGILRYLRIAVSMLAMSSDQVAAERALRQLARRPSVRLVLEGDFASTLVDRALVQLTRRKQYRHLLRLGRSLLHVRRRWQQIKQFWTR